jgi:acetyl esterase
MFSRRLSRLPLSSARNNVQETTCWCVFSRCHSIKMAEVDPRIVNKVDKRVLDTPLSRTTPPPPIPLTSPLETIIGFHKLVEPVLTRIMTDCCKETFSQLHGFTTETVLIKGVDDNDIALYIDTPSGHDETAAPLPCVYHIHGGGMGLLTASDPSYVVTRGSLASRGVIVIGVEFRNASGNYGSHPFPAGLNDCMSGLQWIHQNKLERKISKVVVCGESGGGNLSLALCLKAKRDGLLDLIDGVYARCPFIFGHWGETETEEWKSLPSLAQNGGLSLDCGGMALIARVYTPSPDDHRNPLAWPYWASSDELVGLPPHYIAVNDLDPLIDEGKAYYYKLLQAGVQAELRTVHGTLHALDTVLPDTLPHIFKSTMNSIVAFAKDL